MNRKFNFSVGEYYHLYNRGTDKRVIFSSPDDYKRFMLLLRLCNSTVPVDIGNKLREGRTFEELMDTAVPTRLVDVLAYCLMPNHFHFLLYSKEDPSQIAKFMQSLCIAYSMYFNRRYKRVGGLFQGRFKAIRITNDAYLQHISRYIHLNPTDYKSYKWSSLPYYLNADKVNWLHPERILDIFGASYGEFIDEYHDQKLILQKIKHEIDD